LSTRSRILVIGLVLIAVSAGLTYGLPDLFGISPPEVSVKAEPVFYIHDGFHMGVPHEGGFVITNSMIMAALVTIVLGLLAFFATRNMQEVPRGFQNVAEVAVEGMYNTFGSVDRKYIARFWPMVGTVFFYVLFSNWLALIPGVLSIGYRVPESELHHASATSVSGELAHFDAGSQGRVADVVVPAGGAGVIAQGEGEGGEEGEEHAAEGEEHMVLVPYLRSPSADLNNTLMLGVVAFLYAQFWGFRQLGLGYLYKFVPFRDGAIGLFVGFFEFLSEFVRIVSYAFRLFGNIFAGEVLLLVMAFLFPLLPLPFLGLETFVGFIQAFVFAILVMAFSSLATQGHGDHHDEPHHAEVGGTTRQNPAH
jgi:F-type H+-transporting ATPase subunit a